MGKRLLFVFAFMVPAIPALAQGIAGGYPGDAGIENHPNVIWAEMFESGSVANIVARYDSTQSPENMALDPDVPPGSGGTRSLRLFNGIADLYKMLSSGENQVFLRYYVKYVQPGYHHTNVGVGGYNPPTPWPNPRAGTPSDGTDKLYLGYEPWWNQYMRFYCYWYDNQGPWGDGFPNDENPLPWDQWLCVEVQFKLNTPGRADGEVGLWLDGQQKGTWQGITYRTVPELMINYLWVQHYAVDSNPPGVVKYDHIVMARSYIGPLSSTSTLPAVSVSATDANASEPGTDTGTFTFTRAGSTAAALLVNFAVGGTATNGSDTTAIGTSVTIPAGASSATLTVTPIDDSLVEGNEAVVVTISPSASYSIGTASATVTIADNDGPPPPTDQPPVVSFTNPTGGAILSGTVAVNARANDPDAGTADGAGIANLVIELLQGTTVVASHTEYVVTYDWSLDTTLYADGAYTLRATAMSTSAAGGTSTTANLSITIANAGPPADTDGDGLPDAWEMQYFGNLNQNGSADPDGDGLTNLQEFQRGTDPTMADTDGDGMPDGWEVQYGLNPTSAADANTDLDGDGYTNLEENLGGSNPADPSSIPGAAPASRSGGGGGGGCGATGMEAVLLLGLLGFVRLRAS